MNSPLVSKRAVAAAKVDKRMPARHFRRLQHDRVSTCASERTTAFDPMAFAIGCFQPGTFFWGRVHAEASYQRNRRRKVSCEGLQILGVVAESPLLGLGFFPC
jgi:hypothetical protein